MSLKKWTFRTDGDGMRTSMKVLEFRGRVWEVSLGKEAFANDVEAMKLVEYVDAVDIVTGIEVDFRRFRESCCHLLGQSDNAIAS